jgi:methylthioribose-1-phosphate isomerase
LSIHAMMKRKHDENDNQHDEEIRFLLSMMSNTTSNKKESPTLEAIKYSGGGSFRILDQLALPHETKYIKVSPSCSYLIVKIEGCEDGFNAIKSMTVRGAPAIAIVAALSVAVDLYNQRRTRFHTPDAMVAWIIDNLNWLEESRPTAVNLSDACRKLATVVRTELNEPGCIIDDIENAYTNAAKKMLIDDVNDNRAIGDHGAKWLITQNPSLPKFKVLTHCNTGSLATAGYGTALGVIRSLHAAGVLEHAFCTETRPYNQGSRLTAYELVFEQIPSTLITDSMASALFKKERGMIRAVIVGADRVAKNGDTANKVCHVGYC